MALCTYSKEFCRSLHCINKSILHVNLSKFTYTYISIHVYSPCVEDFQVDLSPALFTFARGTGGVVGAVAGDRAVLASGQGHLFCHDHAGGSHGLSHAGVAAL